MALKLKVTLVRSPIKRPRAQKATVEGLGLRKLNKSRILEDTPSIRGMIRKVQHLVKVEPADESKPALKSLGERKIVRSLLQKMAKRFVIEIHHPRDEYINSAIAGRVAGLAQHWDTLEDTQSDESADKELFEGLPAYVPYKLHTTSKNTGGDHSFTIRQHLVPRFHIHRFLSQGKNKVWALFLRTNKISEVSPKSENFCASRLWSHVAEAHWMVAVENLFNYLLPEISEVIQESIAQEAITAYWALCRSRIKVFGKQPRAFNFPDIERLHYDDENRNKAEKLGLGIYSDRGDETRLVSAALVATFMTHDSLSFRESALRWIVADVGGDPLLLPDYWETPIIPVSPTRMLIGQPGTEYGYVVTGQRASPVNEVLATRHGKNFIISTSKEALLEIQRRRISLVDPV